MKTSPKESPRESRPKGPKDSFGAVWTFGHDQFVGHTAG